MTGLSVGAVVLALFISTTAWAAEDIVRVDVLYTSDIHGHIDPGKATFLNPNFPPPMGGGASAATYIHRVRKEAVAAERPVFLFDSGDIFQGTPVGMHTEGAAVVEWMNSVEYTAMCLGNHEFDRGWENARRLSLMAEFPVLAANLFSTETGERVDWVKDHTMIEADGIKIAVLGYITEATANMSFGDNVEGLEFMPIHEMLGPDAKRMREMGADLVFALMHQGLPWKPEVEKEYRLMLERKAHGEYPRWGMNAMELAHLVEGVDAIFGGHSHQGYEQPWQDPVTHTMVFEPYANGGSIGHITFNIDRETKLILGYDTHFDRGALLTLLEEDVWPDEVFKEVIGAQVAEAEVGLDEVIGESAVNLERGSANNALMGFVVADAYRDGLEADFALQNTGGVRANISPGQITERDILEVSPFDNTMVIIYMTGDLLRTILEDKLRGRGSGIFISGGKVRYDLSLPEGERIVEFTIGGEPVDLEREYKVAVTNYLADGNSGMWRLRELPPEKVLYTGLQDRQILSDYIRKQQVLKPSNDGRWVKVKPGSS